MSLPHEHSSHSSTLIAHGFLAAALLAGACARGPRPAPDAAAPPGADAAAPAHPDLALRRVASAREKLAAQDYEGCLADFKEAIALDASLAGLAPGDAARRLSALLADIGWSAGRLRRMELAMTAGEAGAAAHEAVVAYTEGRDLQAVLLASAAAGVDPGRETFRILLGALSQRTDIPAAPDELLPRAALVQLKLQRAEKAFYDKRYGEAARQCQEALWLDPGNVTAWVRLGSSRFASGERDKAREAYHRALALDPDNGEVRRFLESRFRQK